jgi:hypothetical protein
MCFISLCTRDALDSATRGRSTAALGAMDQPIATYNERRFDGRRVFRLFRDRISISGSTALGPRFELTVPLKTLLPTPDRYWNRQNGFWSGVSMFVLFAVVPLGFASVLTPWWKGFFGVIAAGGLLLALATARRIEWAAFRNAMGQETVNVARSGPDRAQFQSFVTAVSGAITSAAEAAPHDA